MLIPGTSVGMNMARKRRNGLAILRQFRKLKDKIRLEPSNSKYASEEYDSKHDVGIKGVVVWSGRKHV